MKKGDKNRLEKSIYGFILSVFPLHKKDDSEAIYAFDCTIIHTAKAC